MIPLFMPEAAGYPGSQQALRLVSIPDNWKTPESALPS